jgi:hypothetical protein
VIAGPVFITTAYPTVILDKTIVEVMPITEHAYNFWGKEHVSEQDIKTYFPTPLAYPYQFSKKGRVPCAIASRKIRLSTLLA